jgi:hypothetical protein
MRSSLHRLAAVALGVVALMLPTLAERGDGPGSGRPDPAALPGCFHKE